VEYMGMAGCRGEACNLGTMIVAMFKCIGLYSGISILSSGHAYAALSSRCFPLLNTYHKSCDIILTLLGMWRDQK
jgi:hypothetical protein